MKKFYLILILLFSIGNRAMLFAQETDSLRNDGMFIDNPEDTVQITTEDVHSPGRASLYSAVVPGMGQAYNGKHWKIPIIYAGFFTFGYLIYDNNIKYQYFRRNLIAETDGNPETENITGRDEENLRANRDQFRRYRDLNMVLLGVWYLLQIADAHIDAHLLEFKVNPDLTVSVDPAMMPGNNIYPTGVSFKFRFQ